MPARSAFRCALPLLLLAAAAPAANDIQTGGSFVSTVATGTPPLEVTSTTRVDNLNAQYLDGWSAASFSRPLANVFTVSPSGGDFTSIQAALDSITDASFSNPYQILVGPGVYSESVALKSWVSVVGAGQELTTITAVGSDVFGFAATVVGAADAELRSLRVYNDGTGANYSVGVSVGAGKPALRDLNVVAIGADLSSTGIYNSGGSGPLIVEDSRVDGVGSAEASGIYNLSSRLSLERSTVRAYSGSANSAIANSAPSGVFVVAIRDSSLEGATSYLTSDAEYFNYLYFTEVSGGSLVDNGGTSTCAFIIDDTGTPQTSVCP